MSIATGPTTAHCQADLSLGLPGERHICTQTVALKVHVAGDGTPLAYCPREGHRQRHRQRVERYAARNFARAAAVGLADVRYHCGSYQDGRGCSNADCGNWRGPNA